MMQQAKIKTYQAGGYQAEIAPEIGGNLIALRKGDIQILRSYDSYETIRAMPVVYGLPILFPPNRIDGGQFSLDGRHYRFPINEAFSKNSIHGFLHQQAWQAELLDQKDDELQICLSFQADENTDFFRYFPHHFEARLIYTLGPQGLHQKIMIKNRGSDRMPVGLGWHTAFTLRFRGSLEPEQVTMRVSAGERILLNQRLLPDGKQCPLNSEEEKMRTTGLNPLASFMNNHYTAEPLLWQGRSFHGAILENQAAGIRILYEVDPAYRHWMIWNNNQEGSFICIEPQNWRVNAPNLDLPSEQSGHDVIDPGAIWQAEARISATTF